MINQHFYRIPFLLFFFIIFLNSSYSQIKKFSLLSTEGTVYTDAGTKIKFKSFEEKENAFVFTKTNRTKVEIAKSNITQIIMTNKGFAFTNAGVKVRFKSIEEKENAFVFTTTNRTKVEIAKSNIAKINILEGNYGGRGAGISFAITALTISAILVYNELNTEEISVFGSPLLVGRIVALPSIAVGIIGGLIGRSIKKQKTIYSSSHIGYNIPKLQLKTTSQNSIPSLTLSYSFN